MQVKVLFFASLRERLGKASVTLEMPDGAQIVDVWQMATSGKPLPANVLVSVNQIYADISGQVSDGDEVAFFPPVTGG
jgi:molybdopterin synthase sulfur carrier subunit